MRVNLALTIGIASFLSFVSQGCVSPAPIQAAAADGGGQGSTLAPDVQILNPGDVIKVSFPATPSLETTQQIRRDGRINLSMVGEVKASEKTPADLEAELLQLYSGQLVSKEIKITVVSSSFAVFVNGAVLRPGKIASDRAVTALEAIMEAGGFDMTKANAKAVVVIRHEGGTTKSFTLNLHAVLQGQPSEPFYLKSYDIVYVPEKLSWF